MSKDLLDFSHLDRRAPDGTQGNEYPNKEAGVAYFCERFVYLREEGVVLDKLTGLEMSQSNFAKEQFCNWEYQFKYKRSAEEGADEQTTIRYGSIVKAFLHDPKRPYLAKKVYVPGKHQEEIPGCWNTWPGWPYEPIEGDVTLWRALLDHLFSGLPAWEREWFEHWIAHQFQNPGDKIFSAILMSGRSGIGKGTVLRVLEALFGANAHGINENELGSRFTSSVVDKQLVIADEIGVKGADKQVVARRLKGWITEPKLLVERKHKDVEEIDNHANFIFATNDPNPLVQEDDDRRYFDLRFPQTQKIDTTGTGLAPAFFDWFGPSIGELYDSQRKARQAVMHYFCVMDLSRLKSPDSPVKRFEPHRSVPETVSKAGFVERSSSEVMNWLRTLRDSPDEVLRLNGEIVNCTILSTEDIWFFYQRTGDPETRRKFYEQELVRSGFFERAHPTRITCCAGLKQLWIVRPGQFKERFGDDTPAPSELRALYESDSSSLEELNSVYLDRSSAAIWAAISQ